MVCLPLSFSMSAPVPCPVPARRAPDVHSAVLPVRPLIVFFLVFLQFFLVTGPVSAQDRIAAFARQLQALEYAHGARIALAAHEVHSGRTLFFRASERMTFCSTFKFFLVAEILHRADVLAQAPQTGPRIQTPVQGKAQAQEQDESGIPQTSGAESLLDRTLTWTADEEVAWSPVTKGQGSTGMSVAELCRAAITLSDNTATNVLLRLAGGPKSLTRAVHLMGNQSFELADFEPALNREQPESTANTGTAGGFLAGMRRVLLGDFLSPQSRDLLLSWMQATATGRDRIAAALPAGWKLAHKTGTNGGLVHDMGLLTDPKGHEILLVLFSKARPFEADQKGTGSGALLAAATRLLLQEWGSLARDEGDNAVQASSQTSSLAGSQASRSDGH